MKPRTENERIVDKLSKSLPAVSAPQFEWVRSHLFSNEGYCNKGEVFCSCCGHVFKADKGKEKAVCPSCRNELTIKKSRKANINAWKYFTILTTFKGWQIVRNFKVTKRGARCTKTSDGYFCNADGTWTKGNMSNGLSYEFHEVAQCWYNAQGEEVVMGVGKVQFSSWFQHVWRYEPLSVKRNDDYVFSADGKAIYPRIKLLPRLKRNGFKVIDECIPLVIQTLLKNNKAETIFKLGYYDLFMRVAKGHIDFDKEGRWDAFKICVRNHYTLDGYQTADRWNTNKWGDYFDYIDMMVELGKDIHNAKYACPADLKKAHDKAMNKIENLRALERNEEYIKAKQRFLGLRIAGGGITIRPLQSVMEFLEEGTKMHHCVYKAKYYDRKYSLILTARNEEDDSRLETIEVNLSSFNIVQSMGKFDKRSEKHDEIVKLMRKNMGKVKKLARLSA